MKKSKVDGVEERTREVDSWTLYSCTHIYQKRRTGGGGGGEDSLVFQVKGHGAILNSHILSEAV